MDAIVAHQKRNYFIFEDTKKSLRSIAEKGIVAYHGGLPAIANAANEAIGTANEAKETANKAKVSRASHLFLSRIFALYSFSIFLILSLQRIPNSLPLSFSLPDSLSLSLSLFSFSFSRSLSFPKFSFRVIGTFNSSSGASHHL